MADLISFREKMDKFDKESLKLLPGNYISKDYLNLGNQK